MAFLTIFILAPLAFIASLIWTFLIIKKIRTKINTEKISSILLVEIFKIILIIVITILLTIIGMILLIGIIGIPLIFILIIVGSVFLIKYLLQSKSNRNFKLFGKTFYNIIVVLFLSIPIFAIFFIKTVNIKILYLSKNNTELINGVLKSKHNINTSYNSKTTYKFPITIYQEYSIPFSLSIDFDFNNKNINEIHFLKYNVIINNSEYNILDNNKSYVSPSFKNKITNVTHSSTENPKEEEYFNQTKVLIINIPGDDIITSYGIGFENIPINPQNDNKIIVQYDIDIYMNNGKILNLNNSKLFIKNIEKIDSGSILTNLFNKK